MPRDRTGVLIIRAWAEPGSLTPIRVHIRWTTDISTGLTDSATVTDQEAVVEFVRVWLKDVFLGSAPTADAMSAP